MGCKSTKQPLNSKKIFSEILKEIIDRNEQIINEDLLIKEKFNINELLTMENNIEFNPLSYALWKGSPASFKSIHKILKASIKDMENIFLSQNFDPLIICCTHGNLELFSYYLPLYLENPNISTIPPKNRRLTISEPILESFANPQTVVQLACEMNLLPILSYISKYTKSLNTTPYFLDFNYINDTEGENCALIACKHGKYTTIKFLHQSKADFSLKNIRGENALQILAKSNKKHNFSEFYECFVYLADSVKVDLKYNFEDTFLLLEDESVIVFYEKKLEDLGIFFKKKDILDLFNNYSKNTNEEAKTSRYAVPLIPCESSSFISHLSNSSNRS